MKIILDLDTGIDDAMALAYACGHPDAEILGVTSIFGNVETLTAADNASAILKLLNRQDIPVYIGAKRSLNSSKDYVQEPASGVFHGRNGLGGVGLEPGESIQSQPAVDFIIESARRYKSNLTLVTTGPLTNAALAIQKDPQAMSQIKEIVAMGGALTVPGNVNHFAEANFHKDPVANNIIFTSGVKLKVIGLDVSLRTLLSDVDIKDWPKLGPVGEVFHEIVTYYFKAYESSYTDLTGCALHDPLAVTVALEPGWVKGYNFNLKCIEEGDQQGRIVQELSPTPPDQANNNFVALEVDGEAYTKHFLEIIEKSF